MTPYEHMMKARAEAQAMLGDSARVDHVRAEWCERRAGAYWIASYSLPGERGDCNHSAHLQADRESDARSAGSAIAEGIRRDIAQGARSRERLIAADEARAAKELADAVHWQAIPERFSQTHIWAVNDRLIEIEDLEDETAYLFDDADIEAWREDPGARVIVGHACWTKQLARAFRDDPVRQAAEQLHDVIGLFDDGDTPEYLVDALAEAWKAYNNALTEDDAVCWYEATTQAVYMLARELLALVEE